LYIINNNRGKKGEITMGNHHDCCCGHEGHHDHHHHGGGFKIKAITREQKIEQLKHYKKTLKLELEWVEDKIKTLQEMK